MLSQIRSLRKHSFMVLVIVIILNEKRSSYLLDYYVKAHVLFCQSEMLFKIKKSQKCSLKFKKSEMLFKKLEILTKSQKC